MRAHRILAVEPGSIAEELNIEPGDELLSVNDTEIGDIFDYQFLTEDEYIEVLIRKADSGEEWLLEIEKDPDEDLGIDFGSGLMDEYRSCRNRCIFCFIDQMPPGMRETLYFKDDDSRLSFLQGNYVTLTNMSDHDIERIIRYRMEPINVSFQTTNPDLRCRMLDNRHAGEALGKARILADAGIEMNGQIVLCRGINDGPELERTLSDLTAYLPALRSVSVVPVGLTKYRENLYPLEPFTKEDAKALLQTVHRWQEQLYPQWGLHFIHASDEWYLLAEEPLPAEETYDGYLQLENGVGMLRLLDTEVREALAERRSELYISDAGAGTAEANLDDAETERERPHCTSQEKRRVTIATGRLAAPFLRELADLVCAYAPHVEAEICPVRNDFFGEMITVSGLITGGDLMRQLEDRDLGDCLLIPCSMLRAGEEVFLDDVTVTQVSEALHVPIRVTAEEGEDFVRALLGETVPVYNGRKQNYEQTDRGCRGTAECGEIDPV